MRDKYIEMTKEELIEECIKKDNCIDELMERIRDEKKMYSRDDIKGLYNCENAKALSILKLMYQSGIGIKLGKEYYVPVLHMTTSSKNMQEKRSLFDILNTGYRY